jgi:hypothetical protein
MKQYALFSIVVICGLMFFSCAGKSLRMCDKLKNGRFYYFSKYHREKVFLERRDSIQIEAGENDSDLIKGKVAWKNDCCYDIYFNPPDKAVLTADDSIITTTPGHVEITSVNDNYYVCVAKMTIFDRQIKVTDTIYFGK